MVKTSYYSSSLSLNSWYKNKFLFEKNSFLKNEYFKNKHLKSKFFSKNKIIIICYQVDKSSNLNNSNNFERPVVDISGWLEQMNKEEEKQKNFKNSCIGKVYFHNLKLVLNCYFNLRQLFLIFFFLVLLFRNNVREKTGLSYLKGLLLDLWAFILIWICNLIWFSVIFQIVNLTYKKVVTVEIIQKMINLLIGFIKAKIEGYLNTEYVICSLLTFIFLALFFKPNFIQADAQKAQLSFSNKT